MNKREKKRKRLTGRFDEFEKESREALGNPSPCSQHTYKSFIQHQISMFTDGMAAYATRQYARLSLDKYIQSNRESDKTAVKLTKKKRSIVYLGNAEMSPNRPIGIRKGKRCPQTRKPLNSFKMLHNVDVVMVDEYYTSQTCALCFRRFNRANSKHRFKVCRGCVPHQNADVPNMIFTHISNRKKQEINKFLSKVVPSPEPLRSKKKFFDKTLTANSEDSRTIVWHRDIVAAKCILLKGRNNEYENA
ncbi:MAG: hypothetical protein EOP45_17535 [Sphingobacteriaceae bacterium]|nr:MAG: hypothetical protein EOP45_17535 [Sphingobacteriaceae bacterium]